MFTIMNHIICTEIANMKMLVKKKTNSKAETEFESVDAERNRLDRIENFVILLPIIITTLGILVMSVIYKIFV